jgi:acyl-CoA dehydrogenase
MINILSDINFTFFSTIFLILLFICAYQGRSIFYFLAILTFYFLTLNLGHIFWVSYLLISLVLVVPILRKNLLTRAIITIIKKLNLLPKISETEKIALTSGTVWVDGELFSGKPNFKWIFDQKYPLLSKEEEDFLNNEVEELCKICIDHEVYHNRDLNEKTWQYLKEKKFFGMIIAKKYGGLGFSAYGHSSVIQKLASRSVPLAITAMVPNSLGPAELLHRYGTKEQQDYYLPRLAIGLEIPCFALTEATAGSDATSITASGVVFKDENDEIKIRLNWSKRYITLGAIATVIGLAFQLKDPNKILSNQEEVGITCALISYDTNGVRLGRRHDPLATPFINSPINGEDVIIGLNHIIGAKDGVGKGWKMLMECLAAGRAISLPSTAAGGIKLTTRVVSAYAAIRQQFGLSIGKFEGIEEVLARIAGKTYMVEALRSFSAGAVDLGAKPAVISAIAKYHATESFRQVINDGMDIAGGSGIIRGSRNLLANAYFSAPISITVEGANIMTRTLIQFGQGAIMCHPYAYKEVVALQQNNLHDFDYNFFAHIGHLVRNLARSILLSLTRGYLVTPTQKGIIGKYERKIAWASATFALLADLAMARFGGNLKRKEKLNGRFADIISNMYIATSMLKKFAHDGQKPEDAILLDYEMREVFSKMQLAIEGIYQNIFSKTMKIIILPFAFFARFNAFFCPASDNLSHLIAKNLIKNGEFRDSLTKGIYIPKEPEQALGRLENALNFYEKSEPIFIKIKLAMKNKILPNKRIEEILPEALEKKIINADEFTILTKTMAALFDSVLVDEYSLEEYKKI